MAGENELFAILKAQGLTDEQAMAYVAAMLQQQPMDPYLGGFEGDYKDANKAVDYGRDINTLMADPMSGAAAGLGGFGGGALGVDQFMPVREYVQGPENQRYANYLQQPDNSLTGWLARKVQQGQDSVSIAGEISTYLNGDPATFDEAQLMVRQMLETSIPKTIDELSGETRWDTDSVMKLASELEMEKYASPEEAGAQYDPVTGQWYIESPSEMQQKFDELGLPSPTLQYGLEDFTPEGAQLQAQADQIREMMKVRSMPADSMDALNGTMSAFGARFPQDPNVGLYDRLDQDVKDAYARYQLMDSQGGEMMAMQNALQNAARMASAQPRESVALPQPEELLNSRDQPILSDEWTNENDITANPPADSLEALMMNVQRDMQGAQELAGPNVPSVIPPLARPVAPFQQQDQQTSTRGSGRNPGGRGSSRALNERRGRQAAGRANKDFLKASQAQWHGRKKADEFRADIADKRAMGFKSMNDYIQGTNKAQDAVGQGRMDFNLAQAQGRTPLSDTLRQRALAAYLLGG